VSTAGVCRKHGISSATFYAWNAKFGGLKVSDATRPKLLADKNAKLKRLVVKPLLDAAALKDLLARLCGLFAYLRTATCIRLLDTIRAKTLSKRRRADTRRWERTLRESEMRES
jgi:putative transposase